MSVYQSSSLTVIRLRFTVVITKGAKESKGEVDLLKYFLRDFFSDFYLFGIIYLFNVFIICNTFSSGSWSLQFLMALGQRGEKYRMSSVKH